MDPIALPSTPEPDDAYYWAGELWSRNGRRILNWSAVSMFNARIASLMMPPHEVSPAELGAFLEEVELSTRTAETPSRAAYALIDSATPKLVHEALHSRRKRLLAGEKRTNGTRDSVNARWSEITHRLTLALGRPGPVPYDEWLASGFNMDLHVARQREQSAWDDENHELVNGYLAQMRTLVNGIRTKFPTASLDAYMSALDQFIQEVRQ